MSLRLEIHPDYSRDYTLYVEDGNHCSNIINFEAEQGDVSIYNRSKSVPDLDIRYFKTDKGVVLHCTGGEGCDAKNSGYLVPLGEKISFPSVPPIISSYKKGS